MNHTAEKLFTFIKESPTAFQAVEMMKTRFTENGFTELKEDAHWEIKNGGKYFVIRNHSAIIAFTVPEVSSDVFHIIASHSDSPSLKIKENPEMVENGYVKLNVELYGGALLAPWFDRPLSVAGRLIVKEDEQICEKLVTVDKDMLMIPNLAIHMNREANSGYKYNVQKDMLPLYGLESAKGSFFKTVAEAAGVKLGEMVLPDFNGTAENCIEFLKDQKRTTVTFSQGRYITRIKKLAEKHPEECEIVAINKIPGEGEVICAHVPTAWIKIQPGMDLTEEQRKTIGEKLLASRKNNKKHCNSNDKTD